MSASHVRTVRDLLHVLKEGSVVYTQAAQRAEGSERALFLRLGDAKRFQAQQFFAWCSRHPEEAATALTVNEQIHRAYSHLHSILRFRPDPHQVLLRQLDEAEVLLLGAFRAAATLIPPVTGRELSALAATMRQAHEELSFAVGDVTPEHRDDADAGAVPLVRRIGMALSV